MTTLVAATRMAAQESILIQTPLTEPAQQASSTAARATSVATRTDPATTMAALALMGSVGQTHSRVAHAMSKDGRY